MDLPDAQQLRQVRASVLEAVTTARDRATTAAQQASDRAQQASKQTSKRLAKARKDAPSVAELKADGLPEHAIAASLVKSIKKEVVKELIRQTEIRFKDGAPASKSLLDKPVKTLTAYAGSSALSLTDIFKIEEKDGKAIANVKLHDKDLARDFTWQVQLEKDVNGLWTATRILNFTDYLKERMDG